MNTREWAAEYIRLGERPVPIRRGEKAPKLPGWPTGSYTPEDFSEEGNIGLRLGGGRVGLDIDGDPDDPQRFNRALAIIEFLLGKSVPVSRGRRGCIGHFRADGVKSTTLSHLKIDILSDGKQALAPPSVCDNAVREWIRPLEETIPAVDWEKVWIVLQYANALAAQWNGDHNKTVLGWRKFVRERELGDGLGGAVVHLLTLWESNCGHSEHHRLVFEEEQANEAEYPTLEKSVYRACLRIAKTDPGVKEGTTPEKVKLTPLPLPDKLPPDGVWDELSALVDRYLWVPNSEDLLLLKLAIVATYLKRGMSEARHIIFDGEPGTGKNQGLGLFYLCSNTGYWTVSLTNSNLFRAINSIPEISLVIEELTIPKNPDSDLRNVLDLLRAMISRGKKVLRTERGADQKFETFEYDLFGGVAFSTKNYYHVPLDLRERCIRIQTRRAPLEHKKTILTPVDTDETKQIRGKLVSAAEAILADARPIAEPLSFRRSYRFKDLYMTLAPCARYFGLEAELEKALLRQAAEYTDVKRDTFTGEVVRALVEAYDTKGAERYPYLSALFDASFTTTEIRGNGANEREVKTPIQIEFGYMSKRATVRMIANELRRLGCKLVEDRPTRLSPRETLVVLDESALNDLADEYGFARASNSPLIEQRLLTEG